MKVLLLHPDDRLLPSSSRGWDLIVDLGRSPAQTYQAWSEQAGCRVVNLFQFAHVNGNMSYLSKFMPLGRGIVVDRWGIDWWDVISPMLLPDLEQCVMLLGLVHELGEALELYCSRPHPHVAALQKYLRVECRTLSNASRMAKGMQRIRHYRNVFSRMEFGALAQVAFDKFDADHSFRTRFARKSPGDGPVFLLPTAYVNVSRTAVAYASLLPEERFLLAVARPSGKLEHVPENVRMISLDGYFGGADKSEFANLSQKWETLLSRLDTPEFRMARDLGVLQRGPGLIRWGLAARNAWGRLFDVENIAGCLSADDVNPYTSLPLFIARQRNISTLAVHHGAIDGRMAAKPIIADRYLAKGDLELDYLAKTCRADAERIVLGGPPQASIERVTQADKSWLVFFTEPYDLSGWRMDDVYRDLLPPLWKLAEMAGLRLVFKLHPFESVKGHRKLLRKLLTKEQFRTITWIAGALTPELWNGTGFAITVESTVALECATRNIPVFLCAWLQRVRGGYLEQYAKFGVGHVLKSVEEIESIPNLLASWSARQPVADRIWRTIEPETLLGLLNGSRMRRSTIPSQAVAS